MGGGWDAYLERYYYSSIEPSPLALFVSMNMPPVGRNYYYVDDKEIDRSLKEVATTLKPEDRRAAYNRLCEYNSWEDKKLLPALAALCQRRPLAPPDVDFGAPERSGRLSVSTGAHKIHVGWPAQ